jgi:hypothetical protein
MTDSENVIEPDASERLKLAAAEQDARNYKAAAR